jgi:hypothetical protein
VYVNQLRAQVFCSSDRYDAPGRSSLKSAVSPSWINVVELQDVQSRSIDCCHEEDAVLLEENADLADMAGDARGQFRGLLQADAAGEGLSGKHEPNVTRTAFHRSVNYLRRSQSANFDFDLH